MFWTSVEIRDRVINLEIIAKNIKFVKVERIVGERREIMTTQFWAHVLRG